MMPLHKDPASYRDNAGFIFSLDGTVYRQVNKSFKPDFDLFIFSGLYAELTANGLLIQHEEVDLHIDDTDAYLFLKPEQLPFISYPYEWTFDMLKDAALLTLKIAQTAMKHGMMLKDATPYNIQFYNGKPIFIDTLSFEKWDSTKPWIAYRQFCENFLAPLALMHYSGLPLQALQLAYPEGIPLKVASSLLPWKTKTKLHLYLHIHLGASVSQQKNNKPVQFSAQKFKNIFQSLHTAIQNLNLTYKGTWWNYYTEAEERPDYVTEKKRLIKEWLQHTNYKTAFDAGANDGAFSVLLAEQNIFTIAADADHYAVNKLYQQAKKGVQNIHPLLVNLSNPSPGIGVNNWDRKSLLNRVTVDLVVALAVVHHLCIGKNIPFYLLVDLFTSLGNHLLIEFVPKEDEKVALMLTQKKDIYDWYTEEAFLAAFAKKYVIKKEQRIGASNRTLYLLERHEN